MSLDSRPSVESWRLGFQLGCPYRFYYPGGTLDGLVAEVIGFTHFDHGTGIVVDLKPLAVVVHAEGGDEGLRDVTLPWSSLWSWRGLW